MTAQEFAARLHGVKRSGGELKALCPSHDDKTASLSVRDGDKGVVVKCFAGCTVEAITAAVGLTVADLFTEEKKSTQTPIIMTTYDYTDEAGALLYQVVRFIPKDFRQRRPDGAGGWVWKLDGVRRVLYGLPALQGREVVIVVEGERDVQTLTEHGFTATTNAGGAGKWLDDYSQQFIAAGVKQVVVIPDNDPPGQEHAEKVRASCCAVGLTVKIVALAGLPKKGDVSDWFQAGHTADELRATINRPPALQGITPIAAAVATLLDSLDTAPPSFMSTPFQNLNRLLCGGLVPGELYYLAAKGGEGKSALAIELARYVSRDHGVLVVSQEMGLTAIVRRFLAQEAQVSATKLRQHNLNEADWGRLTAAAGRLYSKQIWLADHAPTVKAIESKLDQLDGVELILVDYLQLLRGDGKDSRAQIEAISKGLRDLSKQRQVAIFALSAVSARGDGRDKPSMHWLRGSGMLEHDPDVILLLHQPNPPDRARELIIVKARDAQCGTVKLHFAPEIVHFVEREEHRHDPYS
jgi:archaellum biogenesis ATPase FlaH